MGCGVAALLGAAGCAVPPTPLRVASNTWPGYEPMYLARDLGLLEEPRVRLVELLSATDCLHALSGGYVDGAGLTLDEVLTARSQGLPLTVVMVFNFSAGADVIVGRPELQGLADLVGRRVGVEQTAVGALMLGSALAHAGIDPARIERVHLTIDEQGAAFLLGDVDAVVTFEPVAGQLLEAGAVRLFDSREIPDQIVDVLAFRPEAIGSHGEAIVHLLRAHYLALEYLRAQPMDAAYRIAPRLGIPPEKVRSAFAGIRIPGAEENRRLLAGTPAPLYERAHTLTQWMQENRLIAEHPALFNGLLDATLLERAFA